MRTLSATLAIFALSLASSARANNWDLDASHTIVGFSVRHLVISKMKGQFKKFNGSISLDDQDPTRSTISASIDPASVDTNEPKRDEHLRSADFFDVTKFKDMSFHSKKIERTGDKLKVTGELTMHGVTRPIVLSVQSLTKEVKDPFGFIRRGFSASATLNRKDFGLSWNTVLETGGLAVGEVISIEIEGELIKKS
jgi:polyisoprenoid-binding protein YceI